MREQLQCGLTLRWLFAVLATACGTAPSPSEANPNLYLTDARYRRAELVESLVNPENGYSILRLSHYESDDAGNWSDLPEWNPASEPLTQSDLDDGSAGAPVGSAATALIIDAAARAATSDALMSLGEAAFFHYPMQLAPPAEAALQTVSDADRFGLWADDAHGVGGLVRVALDDGTTALAETCSTCHAGVRDGALVTGVPNERLDWGALVVQATPELAPDVADNLLAWGPGRLDVTTSQGTEPCRIADLRPVRWLTHLQADATVAQHDVTALAIRIETLIITAHGQTLRPPREIALGLALFVRSLADTLPDSEVATNAEPRGAAVFEDACSSCHAAPGFTGPPVPLDVVGTDPMLGRSADRGTGTYRVPSLHGVSSRGPLFHDGRLPNLAALLDPARTSSTYAGALHGTGPVIGHPFGLALQAADRVALLAFLQGL